MTITRLWQAGLESNGTSSHTGEFSSVIGVGIATSSTYAKSGIYSCRITSGYSNVTVNTSQLRAGFHALGFTLISNSYPSNIMSLRTASANLVALQVKNDSTLALVVATTERSTFAFASPTTAFKHFGLDAKIDVSAGWAVAYIDGVEVMRYEGNTGGSAVVNVRYGDEASGFSAHTYYDDLFIDDTTGEAAAAPVPDRRFYPLTPNGNGNYSDGVGSDSNSTDNYLLVDDRPHNSDTDYIVLDAADEKETYTLTTATPPTNFTFAAIIPFVYAKKTDAEIATQLALLTRLGSTDAEGAAQNLPTSYGLLWERFTTKPGGGAWTQSDIDGVEVGYQGEGTF